MNKKHLLIAALVIIVLLVGIVIWLALRPMSKVVPNNSPIATSTQAITTTTSSPTSVHQVQIWGQYTISPPDALMLVDSEGRRTGKDPRTGIIYREIPNTGYQEIASTPGHLADELTFSNLPKGQYTLYVLGGQTGPYAVDIANNQGQSALEGTVQDGSMVAYPQNYDPTNLASSTFSVSSTISSTASITTAPPNNWVPPPVQ